MIGEHRLKTPEGKDTDYTVTNGFMRDSIWFKFHIENHDCSVFETIHPIISIPKKASIDGLIHDFDVIHNEKRLFTFRSYWRPIDGKNRLFVNAITTPQPPPADCESGEKGK